MVYELYEQYSEEEISRMVDAYVVATDGIYGDSEDSVRLYLEEILADQYSGMNRGGKEAARAREAVAGTAQRFAGDIENARQNRTGIERRNGPGVRLSIQEDTDLEEKNITNGNAAVKSLIEQAKTSNNPDSLIVKNAMYRSDIGPIDIKWGTPGKRPKFKGGYGLAHIVEKRNAETGNGESTAYQIVEAIAKATVCDKQYSNQVGKEYHRLRLHYNGTTAVLSKEPDNNHWLLTGWNENETAANANGEVHDSSAATTVTPTRTRRNGDATVSNPSIAQTDPDGNTFISKNEGEIDWIGNRDEDRTGKDQVYLQAVKEGRKDEAKWMMDEAAKEAGYTHKGFHQTGADFTSFSTKNEVAGQFDDETPTGIFIKPTDEDIGLTSGKKQMPLYFKADNMLEFADRVAIRDYWKKNVPGYAELAAQLQEKDEELKRQYDELDAEWFKLYEETYDSDDQSALDALDKRQDEFLEEWNKALQPLRRQMKNLVTAYMKESKYDGIHLKYDGKVYGGPKVETYIVFDPEQVKSAEPVTYDDQGNVIPLSERFRADRVGSEEWKNRDIRFSPSEDDGEIDWIGKAQEDEDGEDGAPVGTTPHPSPAATPSPKGEGLGRQVAGATEEAEDGGRPVTAPTETGERIATAPEAPRNDSYAGMAKEKKVEIAERAGNTDFIPLVPDFVPRLFCTQSLFSLWIHNMQNKGTRKYV